jgi:hypothetical protein
MKKREIRYKDYQVKDDIYTVKLTYLPSGGIEYNPVVRVQVMEQHSVPCNLWERITEWWKYNIKTYVWDPLLIDVPLDSYCCYKCVGAKFKNDLIKKGETEWRKQNEN